VIGTDYVRAELKTCVKKLHLAPSEVWQLLQTVNVYWLPNNL